MHPEMKAKGETRNWATMGCIIGLAVGGVLAVFEMFLYSQGAFATTQGPDEVIAGVTMAQIGIPIVLILFGGLGGALIGAGTPRFNRHPQQGRGLNAYHYLKNWRNRPQPRIRS